MININNIEFVEVQAETVGVKMICINKPIMHEHLIVFNDDRSIVLNEEEFDSVSDFLTE